MTIVQDLERMLDTERKLLLAGEFAALASLAEEKAALAERLGAGRPDLPAEDYARLSERAAHNEALLRSARRGIQAAMAQLRQFSDGEHQSTYSREGERRPLTRTPSVIQKF